MQNALKMNNSILMGAFIMATRASNVEFYSIRRITSWQTLLHRQEQLRKQLRPRR